MLDPGELLLGQRGVEEVGAWGEDEEDEDEDTRGVDALIEWFKGPVAAEMRRVAGITTVSSMDGTGGAGTGAGAGNSSNVAPAAAVGNTGAGAPASVGTGSGILPSTGAGEAVMEAGPITWLNGRKSLFLPLSSWFVRVWTNGDDFLVFRSEKQAGAVEGHGYRSTCG